MMQPTPPRPAGTWTEAFMGLESLGLQPSSRGKVREIAELGERLLIVATDRISAFDLVMPNGIPGRGTVLGRIAAFWFRGFSDLLPTHFISNDPNDFPEPFKGHAAVLSGRAMLVRRAERIEVECIVRGYLAGSGYADYRQSGEVSGVKLPAGLKEFDPLPEPIFTPTTKADEGHDEPMTPAELVAAVGADLAEQLKLLSLEIYRRGAEYARRRGIVVADTKFEFGHIDGKVTLIDEVLTPDSSRFWPVESVGSGKKPVSLDKQFLRDYLISIRWDRKPPAPRLPDDVIQKTQERYRIAERLLTAGAAQPVW